MSQKPGLDFNKMEKLEMLDFGGGDISYFCKNFDGKIYFANPVGSVQKSGEIIENTAFLFAPISDEKYAWYIEKRNNLIMKILQ